MATKQPIVPKTLKQALKELDEIKKSLEEQRDDIYAMLKKLSAALDQKKLDAAVDEIKKRVKNMDIHGI